MDGMAPADADLEARVTRAVRVMRRDAALRATSVAAAGAALGLLAGLPALVAVAVPLAAAGGWLRPRRAADVAARLDDAAGLEGALSCAWDHRASPRPIDAAQRRRALRDLARREPVRPAPRPSLLWALPSLLWIAIPLRAPTPPDDRAQAAAEPSEAAPGLAASGEPRAAALPDMPAETAARAGEGPGQAGLAPASEAADDAGAPASGPAAVASGPTAGKGGESSDIGSGAAGRLAVALADGAGAGLRLPAGVSPGPVRAGVVDPVRPYPRRFHPVIAAWFDRDRQGRARQP